MKKDNRIMVSLRLDPDLHIQFKIACAVSGHSAQTFLEEKVRDFVKSKEAELSKALACSPSKDN